MKCITRNIDFIGSSGYNLEEIKSIIIFSPDVLGSSDTSLERKNIIDEIFLSATSNEEENPKKL